MVQLKRTSSHKRASMAIGPTFAFMVTLCFIVGVSNNLVNSLNSSMAAYLDMSDVSTTLMQIIYYGSYAIAALPAFFISRHIGYQGGLITGLVMFALGCVLSIPSTYVADLRPHLGFAIFLVGLLILSIGVAMLDANYNPYVTKLGPEEGEVKRINFTNGFTGLGSIIGPFLLSFLMVSSKGDAGTAEASSSAIEKAQYLGNIRLIYLGLALFIGILVVILCIVKLPPLPRDRSDAKPLPLRSALRELLRRPYFVFGSIAAFFALGLMFSASTLVGWAATELDAGVNLSALFVGMSAVVSTVGRFGSVPLMAKRNPRRVFGVYMIIALVLFSLAALFSFVGWKLVGFIAFLATFYFMAITYVTTFSLTLKNCNEDLAKAGSCFLLFLYIGGGLFTLLFTYLGTLIGFLNTLIFYVPFLLYMVWFAFKGSAIGLKQRV